MIILSTFSLLISNAVSLRRDMSILYNRIAIIALLYAILQSLISFSIISNSGIGIHGVLFHVTNITQVFQIFLYLKCILILQLTSFYPRKVWVAKYSFLKKIWLHIQPRICMLIPAGCPLFFGLLFLVIYEIKQIYKNNKSFFIIENYVFIQLNKIKLGIVLYILVYITIVLLPLFFFNGSLSISINFISFNWVELLAFFLSILLVFIGFLSKGVTYMVEFIYKYINTLINIIIILGIILIYLYLMLDLNLNVAFYTLFYFRYFRLTMLILISLFMIFNLNTKGLFHMFLIISISYLIYNISSFLGLVFFINLINDVNLTFTRGSLSFGSRNQVINNYNLLDDLLDIGAKALIENSLYWNKLSKYNYSTPIIGIEYSFVKFFVSFFKTLFDISNNKCMYIPSVFQSYSLPQIINIKLELVNESPILLEVIKTNFKIRGGASVGGSGSNLPVLINEPLFENYPENSIGNCLISKNSDKIPPVILQEIIGDTKLCSVIINDSQKYVLDYLFSSLENKCTNFVCFLKDSFYSSNLEIFDYKDIHYNSTEKISLYHKIGDYPDRLSMLDGAKRYIDGIKAGSREVDPNLHWLGGLVSGDGDNKYSAYIFIKHDWIFSIENLKEYSIGNMFIGTNRAYPNPPRFTKNSQSYDPSKSDLCERSIGIYDHYAEEAGRKKKYFKLPFNSPGVQKFSSDVTLFGIEGTNLNKDIFFYSRF